MKRGRQLSIEQFEPRTLQTLVFVFNGNAYAAAEPNDQQTQSAAALLSANGNRAVQLATPGLDGPEAFYQIARQIRSISKGRPIGLMGFSAGGTLALRLASLPGLNVRAALSYYGPPDLRDYLQFHRGDRFYRKVTTGVRLNKGIIKLLSGPSATTANAIEAFGLRDHNVVASESAASFKRDFPDGRVYYYPGPHGVGPGGARDAFSDFLNHL